MSPAPGPSFRERLRRGDLLIGLAAYVVRSVEILTVARTCGFDFLLVDTEHTAIGIADAATISVAAAAAGFPALVRVGGPDHPDLARMLDCGALGTVVPHVDSAEQARRVVERCRFAPVGRRSIPGPQAGLGFRLLPVGEMIPAVERETVLVAMVESRAGLEEAEAIASVSGIDAIMIGANDLADDLGHTGDLAHPEVLAGFRHVAEACRRKGLAFAVIGLPEPLLASHAPDASLIVATNDINLLVDAGSVLAGRMRRLGGSAET